MAATDYNIVPYRGMVDASGCTLSGRVLERPLQGGPREDDTWWDNLRNAYQRFDSQSQAGVGVAVTFRGQTVVATSDAEGYYNASFPPSAARPSASHPLWEHAEVTRAEGGPVFFQPVLSVPPEARYGVISDLDDTVIESSITHWQTTVRLTFLHNARTRKPLEGVAKLYQAFQHGRDGLGPNPIFYVSASPWNLYDLLEDFFELNAIPQGPILLRDLDLDRAAMNTDAGARSKLENIHMLIERYPRLQWILMGDSGQIDAELYAQTIDKYPGRVLAVYIRDIDPSSDSTYDSFVDGHIENIAASGVPMLRVTDSNAIAAHARQIGLIEPEEIAEVAQEVRLDQSRPELKDAVKDSLQGENTGAPAPGA